MAKIESRTFVVRLLKYFNVLNVKAVWFGDMSAILLLGRCAPCLEIFTSHPFMNGVPMIRKALSLLNYVHARMYDATNIYLEFSM